MATITAQVVGLQYVGTTGSIIPCVGHNRGLDIAARQQGAKFILTTTLSYYSNRKFVTVAASPLVTGTTFIRQIDPSQVLVDFTIPNVPKPDPGTLCAASIRYTIVDPQNNETVYVCDVTTTSLPFVT